MNRTTLEYSYDKNRNLLSMIYENYRGREVDRCSYTYDAVGNRTQKLVDASSYLKELKSGSYDYFYDNDNRLVEEFTNYIYDFNGNLLEQKQGREFSKFSYDASYTTGPGIDNLIFVTRHNGQAGRNRPVSYFYASDALGSVRQIMDSRGKSVNSYSYTPFGVAYNVKEKVEQPYRYTGRRWDPNVGKLWYRSRHYDAARGRFGQADKWGKSVMNPVGYHAYGYVQGNPVRFVDPMGYMDPATATLVLSNAMAGMVGGITGAFLNPNATKKEILVSGVLGAFIGVSVGLYASPVSAYSAAKTSAAVAASSSYLSQASVNFWFKNMNLTESLTNINIPAIIGSAGGGYFASQFFASQLMESVIVNEFGSILNTATTTGLIIGTSEKVGGNILEKIYNSANQMIDDTKNAIDNAILKTLLQIKGFENEVMRHCTP